jgi:hypothetical protein
MIGFGILIFLLRPPGLYPYPIGYNPYHLIHDPKRAYEHPPNTTPIPRRWRVQPKIPRDVDVALRDFSPFMRQLLYNRGLFDPAAAAGFVAGTTHFPTDPFLLKDMHLPPWTGCTRR